MRWETVETYLDAAPRADAEAHAAGPFTLFVSRTPSGYYARPTSVGGRIEPADVDRLVAACRTHGVPAEVEWVSDLHPRLDRTLTAAGFSTRGNPLMTARSHAVAAAEATGGRVRVTEDPDDLVTARAVTAVAFGQGGTETGPAGPAARDEARGRVGDDLAAHLRSRAERGLTVTAVVEDFSGVVSVGSYQPVGAVAEIVAVATLPHRRRQGLATLVTTHLARHAADHGVTDLLLSAEDDAVARIYAGLGFRRVGTAMSGWLPPDPADGTA